MKKVGKLGPKDQVLVLGCRRRRHDGRAVRASAMFGKGPLAADIDDEPPRSREESGRERDLQRQGPASAKRLMADTGGGAYAVVDFVGSEKSFAFASQTVRRGGKVIIVGLFGGAMQMPLPDVPVPRDLASAARWSARSTTPRR